LSPITRTRSVQINEIANCTLVIETRLDFIEDEITAGVDFGAEDRAEISAKNALITLAEKVSTRRLTNIAVNSRVNVSIPLFGPTFEVSPSSFFGVFT